MNATASLNCLNKIRIILGLKARDGIRLVNRARSKGRTAGQCTNARDRMLLEKYRTGESYAVAYNGLCFIFAKDCHHAITCFQLPSWFGKTELVDANRRHVRNPRKYMRMHPEEMVS